MAVQTLIQERIDTSLPKHAVTRTEVLKAVNALFEQTADVPEMTLDEINEEVSDVRKKRRIFYKNNSQCTRCLHMKI